MKIIEFRHVRNLQAVAKLKADFFFSGLDFTTA